MRNRFLSLDPYMRGRMNDAKSYAKPQPLERGDGRRHRRRGGGLEASGYQPGDSVVGMGGWQQYSLVDASAPGVLRKVDTSRIPLSAYLGAVGMPGVTAWYGLMKICEPKPGQTIVVSAASGAVGSVVGQLAKARGCRAVGIAGGADKCGYVTDELGFDACIDYKAHADPKALYAALKAGDARRRRRLLRERRRRHPRRHPGAHERVRPDRPVRNDQRLRRRSRSRCSSRS